MMDKKAIQRAGDQSNQFQVAGDLVMVSGITEERAKEIAEIQVRKVMEELSKESEPLAAERISQFNQRLVTKMSDQEDLSVFADPGFQLQLRKAQLRAACTSEVDDHELLVT